MNLINGDKIQGSQKPKHDIKTFWELLKILGLEKDA